MELSRSDDEQSWSGTNSCNMLNSEAEEIVVHASTGVPLPCGVEEKQEEVIFVDPSGSEGKRILSDPETSVAELFALLRQPVSPVCDNVDLVIEEMLNRKVGPNDVDAITGMSVLHYAVRAESIASNKSVPVQALKRLMSCGGDLSQRTLYTDMNALHLASFFNASLSIEVMLNDSEEEEVDRLLESLSGEFSYGSALHIAATNLCPSAAGILVTTGADVHLRDDMGRTAMACIPRKVHSDEDIKCVEKLKSLFHPMKKSHDGAYDMARETSKNKILKKPLAANVTEQSNRPTEHAYERNCNFSVGDHVIVAGSEQGIVRFVGTTKFSSGVWCGVELDEPVGRNDGSISGVRYFNCDASRGIFAPPNKLELAGRTQAGDDILGSEKQTAIHDRWRRFPPRSLKPEQSHHTSNTQNTLTRQTKMDDLKLGMTVYVNHLKEYGKIKYIGETDFANGIWVGLALQHPLGKNNGTVQGREYFKCRSRYGTMVRPSSLSVGVDSLGPIV